MRLILIGVIAWFAVSAVLSPGAVQAQETAPGRFARIVVLAPNPGWAEFEKLLGARANAPPRSAADADTAGTACGSAETRRSTC